MSKIIFLSCLLLVLAAPASYANRWGEQEVTDRISGNQCVVPKLLGFGGYVSDDESKFDLVFFPENQLLSVWFCPESGYISFSDDFHDVSEAEKKSIRKFLSKHYSGQGKDSRIYQYWLIEQLYKLRNKDKDFWAGFYPRLGVLVEKHAGSIRYQAYPYLEGIIADNKKDIPSARALYMLGEFSRHGKDYQLANKYFCQAKALLKQNEDCAIKEVLTSRAALLPDGYRDCNFSE